MMFQYRVRTVLLLAALVAVVSSLWFAATVGPRPLFQLHSSPVGPSIPPLLASRTHLSSLNASLTSSFSVGNSALTRHFSLPHPSCLAEEHMRQHISSSMRRVHMHREGGGRGRITETSQQFAAKYVHPEWNCYKHGGHYRPGYARMNGSYLTLRNVLFSEGMFFWGSSHDSSAVRSGGRPQHDKIPFSGYFSMVSGNWPQLVTNVFLVRHDVPAGLRAAAASRQSAASLGMVLVEVDTAYYQPPTDFLSTYHATVETVMPAFHRLADRAVGAGVRSSLPAQPTLVLTSRPKHSRYGFKRHSCHFGPACVTEPQWGQMFLDVVGGQSQVAGLGFDEPQFEHIMDEPWAGTEWSPGCTSTALGRNGSCSVTAPQKIYKIANLRVGNPTHCEPLWGPDAFFVEAAGDAVKQSQSFVECQQVLFAFRNYFLRVACERLKSQTTNAVDTPMCSVADAVIHQGAPIGVLFTSRRGDWAREIVNEDSVVAAIRQHLRHKFPNRISFAEGYTDGVRVIKFSGPYENQLQAVHENATLFVANHGANIIPSIYMRPNGGVITLSFEHPGFYPFNVFPEWLHWRDLVVEQECNRRLWRGKCKWSTGNNNDMRVSKENLMVLLSAMDDIIAAQDLEPKSGLRRSSQK